MACLHEFYQRTVPVGCHSLHKDLGKAAIGELYSSALHHLRQSSLTPYNQPAGDANEALTEATHITGILSFCSSDHSSYVKCNRSSPPLSRIKNSRSTQRRANHWNRNSSPSISGLIAKRAQHLLRRSHALQRANHAKVQALYRRTGIDQRGSVLLKEHARV